MINEVVIVGRLGRDPEALGENGGARLSIACNERWTDAEGVSHEHVEWVPVKLWGKTGKNALIHLTKGRLVGIKGRIRTQKWEKDGVVKWDTFVKGYSCKYLDANSRNQNEAQSPNTAPPDDNIPF